jgi:hypothetical protein
MRTTFRQGNSRSCVDEAITPSFSHGGQLFSGEPREYEGADMDMRECDDDQSGEHGSLGCEVGL